MLISGEVTIEFERRATAVRRRKAPGYHRVKPTISALPHDV